MFWLKAPLKSFKAFTLSYSAVSWALMLVSALTCELMVACWFCSCTSGCRSTCISSLTTVLTSMPEVLPLKASFTLLTMLLMVLP